MNSGCAGAYIVYVDTMTVRHSITVTTSDGIPYVNLTDSNGLVWAPTVSVNQNGVSASLYEGLRPGIYQLTVKNAATTTSYCVATIEGSTLVSGIQQFVQDVHQDISQYGEAGIDGVEAYFIAHLFNLPAGADARELSIRTNYTVTPQFRTALLRRYGCQFEYYADQYVCHEANTYFWNIDGIDAEGFKFRRSGAFACLSAV